MLSLVGLAAALVLPSVPVVDYRVGAAVSHIETPSFLFPATTGLLAGGENWYTPSAALDTDCEGRPVRRGQKLSQECIYQRKVEEIRERQAAETRKAELKVAQMVAMEKAADERAAAKEAAEVARKAAKAEAVKAATAKAERTGDKPACLYCGN